MSTAPNDAAPQPGQSPASQLGQLRAMHEALQRFVAQRAASAGQGNSKPAPGPEPAALAQELAGLRARNAVLERELEAARAAGSRPAPADGLPAADPAVLAELRAQDESLREQLTVTRQAEAQVRATLAQMQFERHGMLGELQVLRSRAIELAEELSRERQHSLAERQLWHNELSHWRRLLESHFVRLSGPRVPPNPRAVGGLDLGSPSADETLTSILHMIEHHPEADS